MRPRMKSTSVGNDKPFMTKAYSKAIKQERLFRIKFLTNLIDQNKLMCNKQRN